MSKKNQHLLKSFLGLGLMAYIVMMRPEGIEVPRWVINAAMFILGAGTLVSFLLATGVLKEQEISTQSEIQVMGHKKLFYKNAAYAAALSVAVLLFKYLDNGLDMMKGADLLLMFILVIIGLFVYTLGQVWLLSRQKQR